MRRTDIIERLKEQLAYELLDLLHGWDQTEAGALVGLRQPDVSRLRAGRFERFSVGRLLRLIASRGYHIEIALKPIGRPTVTRQAPAAVVQRYDQIGKPIEYEYAEAADAQE
jgi:predicted XRE-type DNA-binding protein